MKGGLKAVEVRLGIARRLTDMNGYMAVRLWWDYVNNNDLKPCKGCSNTTGRTC